MDPRIEPLVIEYLEDHLDEAGAHRLIEHLQTHDDDRAEFLALAQEARILDSMLSPGRDLSRAVLDELRARDDANRFVRNLEHRIRESASLEAPSQQASEDGPGPRRLTSRRLNLRQGSRSSFPALLAAGLFLGVVLVVFISWPSGAGGPKEERKTTRVKPMPETPKDTQRREEIKAEAWREEAQKRLKEIERERERLAGEERAALAQQARESVERARQARVKLESEREQIEREMKEAIARSKASQAPSAPEVKPAPTPQAGKVTTASEVTQIERVEGEAWIVRASGREAAREGQGLVSDEGLETAGAKGFVVLAYSDKTRLEVGPETSVRELKAVGGKRLFVAKGDVRAVISKQPKDQPMILASPHGEAKVVGTTLRVLVDSDPKKGTRLEVEEGRVQFKNHAGKTVSVESGYYAVAAMGHELAAKLTPIDEILLTPKQGKAVGNEWRLGKDEKGQDVLQSPNIMRNFPSAPGFPVKRDPNYLGRIPSYVLFTFTAEANRDYSVWIRGYCTAREDRLNHDSVALEPMGTEFVPPCVYFGPAGANGFMFDSFYQFSDYDWIGGSAGVMATLRFPRTGTQALRLYAIETPMNIAGIWLSTTQKTAPPSTQRGPETQKK